MASKSPLASTEDNTSFPANHTATNTFQPEIDSALHHENQTILKMNDAETKGHSIDSSQQQRVEQQIEVECKADLDDDERTLKPKQIRENQQSQSLCSYKQLIDASQPKLCSKQTNNGNSIVPSTETHTSAATSSVPGDETINILLLGESGVGKSTFINTFVNYLTYETLNEAASKQPIVLMPVSFIMTTGDNFTEHTVELNVSDTLSNEDFKYPGQSVTQRCRSYVFHLQNYTGKKLRIIDTPGFGDTRGLDQDDLNMQHILEYINNLTHLNAVCFLLKPNVSRIHVFFRLCLAQLLDFLGPNVRQNIIFCFTNSRTTFYTPGDTAPLLKTILKSLSSEDILFQKQNTFCFDSESFRYLVALQKSIQFSEVDRNEYEKSWSISANEFNRLLNHICQNRTLYRMHDDWQSIKHAQLEIIQMIRPIVEAMRNILRNIILYDSNPVQRSIKMCATPIHHPITICLSCKHELHQTAKFWFLPDFQDNNHKCSNTANQYIIVDYILDHNMASDRLILQKNELLDHVSLLLEASAVFSNFLMHTTIDPKDDLFLAHLTRTLDEEKYICGQKSGHYRSIQLSQELQILMHKYIYRLSEVKVKEEYTQLSTIYNWIKMIRDIDIPDVRVQLNAVKRGREDMMEQYEYEVPSDAKKMSTLQSLCF